MNTPVIVPTLGESVAEATVAKWLKKVGDPVSTDEVIVELETDKVSVEVTSPNSGYIDLTYSFLLPFSSDSSSVTCPLNLSR